MTTEFTSTDQAASPLGSASSEGLGQPRKLLGYMYLARKSCGKVSAAAWDDKGHEKDTAKSVARWVARGDTVQRVARHEGDPQPDWSCARSEQCACRDANLLA